MTKEIKEILDYIEYNTDWNSHNDIETLRKHITNLQEDLANYVNVVLHDRKVIDDYKSRIDEAIFYMRDGMINYPFTMYKVDQIDVRKLLEILQGEDNE